MALVSTVTRLIKFLYFLLQLIENVINIVFSCSCLSLCDNIQYSGWRWQICPYVQPYTTLQIQWRYGSTHCNIGDR